MILARRVSLVAMLCTSGCGWTVWDNLSPYPIRPGEPPASYQIDEEASSVEYTGNDSPTERDAASLRGVVSDLLQARSRPSTDGSPVLPARFRLKVEVARTVWPHSWYPLCLYFQIFGCPTGDAKVSARLELQVGTEVYVGDGSGSATGGFYYYNLAGTPKATARALELAVQSLALSRAPAVSGRQPAKD